MLALYSHIIDIHRAFIYSGGYINQIQKEDIRRYILKLQNLMEVISAKRTQGQLMMKIVNLTIFI